MFGTVFLVRRVLDFQCSCVCSWEAQLGVGIDFVCCDVDVLMETELILNRKEIHCKCNLAVVSLDHFFGYIHLVSQTHPTMLTDSLKKHDTNINPSFSKTHGTSNTAHLYHQPSEEGREIHLIRPLPLCTAACIRTICICTFPIAITTTLTPLFIIITIFQIP